jgi:hypothetical protein
MYNLRLELYSGQHHAPANLLPRKEANTLSGSVTGVGSISERVGRRELNFGRRVRICLKLSRLLGEKYPFSNRILKLFSATTKACTLNLIFLLGSQGKIFRFDISLHKNGAEENIWA